MKGKESFSSSLTRPPSLSCLQPENPSSHAPAPASNAISSFPAGSRRRASHRSPASNPRTTTTRSGSLELSSDPLPALSLVRLRPRCLPFLFSSPVSQFHRNISRSEPVTASSRRHPGELLQASKNHSDNALTSEGFYSTHIY